MSLCQAFTGRDVLDAIGLLGSWRRLTSLSPKACPFPEGPRWHAGAFYFSDFYPPQRFPHRPGRCALETVAEVPNPTLRPRLAAGRPDADRLHDGSQAAAARKRTAAFPNMPTFQPSPHPIATTWWSMARAGRMSAISASTAMRARTRATRTSSGYRTHGAVSVAAAGLAFPNRLRHHARWQDACRRRDPRQALKRLGYRGRRQPLQSPRLGGLGRKLLRTAFAWTQPVRSGSPIRAITKPSGSQKAARCWSASQPATAAPSPACSAAQTGRRCISAPAQAPGPMRRSGEMAELKPFDVSVPGAGHP